MKKYKILILTSLILVALLGLSACKPAGPATPSAVEIATRVAETQMAKATEMAFEQMTIKLTELSKPTNTPMPTATPMPMPTLAQPTAVVGTPAAAGTQTNANPTTAAATPNPAANQSVKHWDKAGKCYFSFEFMGDTGAVQTGSTVKKDQTVIKQWRIKNNGTCSWALNDTSDPDHLLYLKAESGNTLQYTNGNNTPVIPLCYEESGPVVPGDTCTVQVSFYAPSEGKFYDYWNVMTPLGEFIGYGPSGNWSLGISVSAAN
jgi:hypothetical protein